MPAIYIVSYENTWDFNVRKVLVDYLSKRTSPDFHSKKNPNIVPIHEPIEKGITCIIASHFFVSKPLYVLKGKLTIFVNMDSICGIFKIVKQF